MVSRGPTIYPPECAVSYMVVVFGLEQLRPRLAHGTDKRNFFFCWTCNAVAGNNSYMEKKKS